MNNRKKIDTMVNVLALEQQYDRFVLTINALNQSLMQLSEQRRELYIKGKNAAAYNGIKLKNSYKIKNIAQPVLDHLNEEDRKAIITLSDDIDKVKASISQFSYERKKCRKRMEYQRRRPRSEMISNANDGGYKK